MALSQTRRIVVLQLIEPDRPKYDAPGGISQEQFLVNVLNGDRDTDARCWPLRRFMSLPSAAAVAERFDVVLDASMDTVDLDRHLGVLDRHAALRAAGVRYPERPTLDVISWIEERRYLVALHAAGLALPTLVWPVPPPRGLTDAERLAEAQFCAAALLQTLRSQTWWHPRDDDEIAFVTKEPQTSGCRGIGLWTADGRRVVGRGPTLGLGAATLAAYFATGLGGRCTVAVQPYVDDFAKGVELHHFFVRGQLIGVADTQFRSLRVAERQQAIRASSMTHDQVRCFGDTAVVVATRRAGIGETDSSSPTTTTTTTAADVADRAVNLLGAHDWHQCRMDICYSEQYGGFLVSEVTPGLAAGYYDCRGEIGVDQAVSSALAEACSQSPDNDDGDATVGGVLGWPLAHHLVGLGAFDADAARLGVSLRLYVEATDGNGRASQKRIDAHSGDGSVVASTAFGDSASARTRRIVTSTTAHAETGALLRRIVESDAWRRGVRCLDGGIGTKRRRQDDGNDAKRKRAKLVA